MGIFKTLGAELGSINLEEAEPILCACGCEQPINHKIWKAKYLRTKCLTTYEISNILEVSRSAVETYLRRPSKYIKGHWAKKLEDYSTKNCKNCNREFRAALPDIEYCNVGICNSYRYRQKRERELKSHGDKLKESRKIAISERKFFIKKNIEQERIIYRRKRRIEKETALKIERELRKRERIIFLERQKNINKAKKIYQKYKDKDIPLPWHSPGTLNKKLISASDRNILDELIYEQAREESKNNYSWGERKSGSKSPSFTLSLDASLNDESNSSMIDFLTSRQDFTPQGEIADLMINNITNTQSASKRRTLHLITKEIL